MLQLSLGIAGTAKNTGKTTATAAILDELRHRGINISLTSIGYDGEDLDNITGLPKPKLRVEPGDIVATAEKCIKVSTAGLSILEDTKVSTPLGKILIAEVKRPGLVVTAGPNKRSDVKIVDRLLARTRPGVVIFDGALNRIAPMSETDGFVLATGAARTQNIVKLGEETGAIAKIASLPAALNAVELAGRELDRVTLFGPEFAEIKSQPFTSLFTERDVAKLFCDMPPDGSQLYVPGIISGKALIALKTAYKARPRRLFLTFQDPIKVLMTGNPDATYQEIEAIEDFGIITGVIRRVPLYAVTVNPFFPEFRVDDGSYREAFVDYVRLELTIKARTSLPVYNVVRHGARGLVDTILLNQRPWESPLTMTF